MAGIRRFIQNLTRQTEVQTRQAENTPVLRDSSPSSVPTEVTGVPISSLPGASTPGSNDVVPGVQSDTTKKFKLGDLLAWIKTQLSPADIGAVDASDVGVAGGVASLDSSGKVPSAQLPAIPSDADEIGYDNTTSGLTATDVQTAIDEVVVDVGGKQDKITANGILKGDGAGGVSAATAGTDYQAPLTAGTDYVTPAQLADKANQSQLAYVETGTTATRNYTAGQYISLNGLLYTADTAIASGATFYTSGGNKNLTECVGGGFNSLSNVTNGNVTFSNDVTGYTYQNEYHLSKSGNVVATHIYMSTSSIAGMGTLLCTVPAAFRPSVNRRIATWLTYNNQSKVETVFLSPTGEITTASGGSNVTGFIRVFGTYIL